MECTFTAPRIRLALTILAWACLGICVYSIADDNLAQWDFQVYYSAAQAFVSGTNPYRPIHPHPELNGDLIFQYPPLTLYAFKWMTLLSLAAAKQVWLGLKLVSFGLLVWLWHRDFERLDASWPIALFLALGLNSALLRDAVCGNISTFEQLGIWFGFSLLVRDRPYAAAAVLACVGQFKLLPGALIALILVVRPRDGWKPFAVGCALYAGLLALNLVFSPDLTHNYLAQFGAANIRMDDRGINNPSSLAMFRDIIDLTSFIPGLDYNRKSGTIAYYAYLIALGLILIRAAWMKRAALRTADPRLLVYLGCAVYAIAMPRLKDYSYILMLIPTLFVIRDIGKRQLTPNYLLIAVGLMICAQPQQSRVPGLAALVYMLQAYLPLLIATAVAAYLLVDGIKAREAPVGRGPLSQPA
jgi:Glycosyltransferase family 87